MTILTEATPKLSLSLPVAAPLSHYTARCLVREEALMAVSVGEDAISSNERQLQSTDLTEDVTTTSCDVPLAPTFRSGADPINHRAYCHFAEKVAACEQISRVSK